MGQHSSLTNLPHLNRWEEHLSFVLNSPADTNAEANARLPQVETNTDINIPPSEEEVKKESSNSLIGKSQVQMPFLLMYTSMVVTAII